MLSLEHHEFGATADFLIGILTFFFTSTVSDLAYIPATGDEGGEGKIHHICSRIYPSYITCHHRTIHDLVQRKPLLFTLLIIVSGSVGAELGPTHESVRTRSERRHDAVPMLRPVRPVGYTGQIDCRRAGRRRNQRTSLGKDPSGQAHAGLF